MLLGARLWSYAIWATATTLPKSTAESSRRADQPAGAAIGQAAGPDSDTSGVGRNREAQRESQRKPSGCCSLAARWAKGPGGSRLPPSGGGLRADSVPAPARTCGAAEEAKRIWRTVSAGWVGHPVGGRCSTGGSVQTETVDLLDGTNTEHRGF